MTDRTARTHILRYLREVQTERLLALIDQPADRILPGVPTEWHKGMDFDVLCSLRGHDGAVDYSKNAAIRVLFERGAVR
jgi:hypothetical protein